MTLEFNNMTKAEKWQHFMRRKYQQFERVYYPIIDDLEQKLHDLDEVNKAAIPDFNVHEFSYIEEWEHGDCDSAYVLHILRSHDLEKLAKAKLTRRMENYVKNNSNTIISDYVEPVMKNIINEALPIYVTYLQMVTKYFSYLVEVDMMQHKVTWLEQYFKEGNKPCISTVDYTFNQVMRQLEYQVMPHNSHKYFVGDNIIVFDETLALNAYATHWIFAPKVYVDLMKKKFKVSDQMDLGTEGKYLTRLIGSALNG